MRKEKGPGSAWWHRPSALLLHAFLFPVATVQAAVPVTPAGTVIANVADATYVVGTLPTGHRSNEDRLVVDERLDIGLSTVGPPVTAADGSVAVAFVVTNAGNGNEAYRIAVDGAPAGLAVVRIVLDGPDGGALANGTTGPVGPGGTIRLIAILRGAERPVPGGAIRIAARADTGSGAIGTVFTGRGDGGSDAIVGPTGAEATIDVRLSAGTGTLEKSQAIRAPDGSSMPVPDAVVTYTLQARFTGPVRTARIADPVPDGTRYVPGSLRLDDRTISDGDDDDPGACDGRHVSVTLADVPSAAVHTLSFQVVIL